MTTTVAIRDVIDAVSEYFGAPLVDLRSARRTAEIVEPRHWTFYLAARLCEKSLSQIGRALCRDPSTVAPAVEKMRKRVEKDTGARLLADELEKAVLALAHLRRPGARFEDTRGEIETPHDIARRIVKGGLRVAMNASVEDVMNLCNALLATPEPLIIPEPTEEETANV